MRAFLLLFALLFTACSPAERSARRTDQPDSKQPKITQFYASPPAVPKGEKTLLCYGVEAATAVRVDPPVEKLSPALSRCFEVTPAATTTYTLTAESPGAASSSQSVTIQVGGSRPKLVDLSINKNRVQPGEQISFCFKARSATRVDGGPGRWMSGGKPSGDCLIDLPKRTTKYRIEIANEQGLTDSADITVEVH